MSRTPPHVFISSRKPIWVSIESQKQKNSSIYKVNANRHLSCLKRTSWRSAFTLGGESSRRNRQEWPRRPKDAKRTRQDFVSSVLRTQAILSRWPNAIMLVSFENAARTAWAAESAIRQDLNRFSPSIWGGCLLATQFETSWFLSQLHLKFMSNELSSPLFTSAWVRRGWVKLPWGGPQRL